MAADWHDSSAGTPARPLGGDVAARVEAIVHAAEREALAVERAIADRRRSAEEEVQRYLAAARLHADAEAAARAARLESLSTAARRLANELTDATAALTHELARSDAELAAALPDRPWPAQPPAPEQPVAEPIWGRRAPAPPAPASPDPVPAPPRPEPVLADDVPSAARLVAIEMAVGGAARAEVERTLREQHGIAEPRELLDDVFGAASHAGSTLAWGEP